MFSWINKWLKRKRPAIQITFMDKTLTVGVGGMVTPELYAEFLMLLQNPECMSIAAEALEKNGYKNAYTRIDEYISNAFLKILSVISNSVKTSNKDEEIIKPSKGLIIQGTKNA